MPSTTLAPLTGLPIQFTETSSYVKLDFTMFVVEFYKGTQGYNRIYDGFGNVLVYDDRIVSEYLFKSPDDWRQRGTPTGISWVKVNDYHYEVTRHYNDYLGTTYDVKYTVKSDSPLKITITLNSGKTDTYRITWSPSGIVKTDWKKEDNRLVFGDESADYGWVGFDWDDVYQSFGNITVSSVETVAQGRKANIYFNVGAVSVGQTLVLDPSTVGTSTSTSATRQPFQRKTFHAQGRFWVFYSNGANMVYRTSTDGISWSDATTVRVCTSGTHFSVWFDGTYVHYAYSADTNDKPLYYRRGTPDSDGIITWGDEQIAVPNIATARYSSPFVAVDSQGYPWVGYNIYIVSGHYPFVTKSSTNDGTWSTAGEFPYQLSATSSTYVYCVSIIPLTSQKILAIYGNDATTIKARKWNGSAWGAEKATTSALKASYGYGWYSAVAQADDVHLVFLKNTGYDILYVKYTYSTDSFGTETTLRAGATATSAPVIGIDTSTNDRYVFWAGYPTADHIYYRKYNTLTSIWETAVDWVDETTDDLTGNDRLTCFYQAYGGYIGLVYMTKTATPWNVRFDFLTLAGGALHERSMVGNANLSSGWARRGQPFGRSFSSTISISLSALEEFVLWLRSFTGNVNLSSEAARQFNGSRSLTWNTSLSSALSRFKEATRSFVGTLAVSSDWARVLVAARSMTGNVSLSSALSRFFGGSRNFVGNVGLSSLFARFFGGARTVVGNLGLSSSMSRLFSPFRSFVGNVNLSSSFSRFLTAMRSITGNMSASSSFTRLHTAIKSFTGNISLSSTFAKWFSGVRSLIADSSLASSFVQEIVGAIQRSFDTAISLSSTFSRTGVLFFRSLAGNVDLSSFFSRLFDGARICVGNLNLSSAFTRLFSPLRSFISDTSLSSSFSRLFTPARSFTSNIALASSLNRLFLPVRSFASNISLASSFSRLFNGVRSAVFDTTLSASLQRTVLWIRAFTSNVSISSSFSKLFNGARTLVGSSNLSSSFTRLSTLIRPFTGNVSLSATLSRGFNGIRTFASTISLSSLLEWMFPAIERGFDAAVSMSSAFVRQFDGARSFLGNLSLSSSLTRFFSGARSFASSSALSSSISRQLTRIRGFTGNISLSSSFNVAYYIFIHEILEPPVRSIAQYLDKTRILYKSIAEYLEKRKGKV